MEVVSPLIALLLGVIQGVLEWLPVSSEGGVTLALTTVGLSPVVTVQLALFLHAGTALAAAVYYREDLADLFGRSLEWRPSRAFSGDCATISFLLVATTVSGIVAIASYLLLIDLATGLTGGSFVALIGGLLVLTGLIQRLADTVSLGGREFPDAVDAVIVGAAQGLAILPGISRSGTTVSVLLFRGHEGESAFRLSFLLSIPAALGAGALSILDSGGVPGLDPAAAAVALAASLLVGYLTIDTLVRLVRRVAFWSVCVAFGGLSIAGGGVLMVF